MADRKASVAESKPIPAGQEPRSANQRDSDRAPKPGFRAPPNAKSKAQKKKKK